MAPDTKVIEREIRALMDAYRVTCLWFLRADYVPATIEEQRRVLGYIERHGDLAGFQRASKLRRWLSQPSSKTSAS